MLRIHSTNYNAGITVQIILQPSLRLLRSISNEFKLKRTVYMDVLNFKDKECKASFAFNTKNTMHEIQCKNKVKNTVHTMQFIECNA